MISNTGLVSQVRALGWPLWGVYALAFITLLVLAWQTQVPVAMLTRDPNAVARVPLYTGAISNIGILFWCAAASICFFCYAIVRAKNGLQDLARFLLYAGLLTVVLMFDDLFEIHERLLRDSLSIPEYVTFFCYGVILLAFVIRFRAVILDSEFVLFLLAILFLALSVIADLAQHHVPWMFTRVGSFLFEDGCKLLGILSWCLYFARVGSKITHRFAESPADERVTVSEHTAARLGMPGPRLS